MRIVERTYNSIEWWFKDSKLINYKQNNIKRYFARYVKNGYLYYSFAENIKDINNNFEKIKFYKDELPPLCPGENIQVVDTPDNLDIPAIDIEHELLIRKEDVYITHKDEEGNEQYQALSVFTLNVDFYKDDKVIPFSNSNIDLKTLIKELEEFYNLIKDLNSVKISDAEIPIIIGDTNFYDNLVSGLYGDTIEENMSWVTGTNKFDIEIKEDPTLFKPYILYDHDGLCTKRKNIVSNNVINPLYDVYFAYKYNKEPTGNGFYLDTGSPNGIGYTYLSIEAKNKINLEELDKAIYGLLFIGWHTCNWFEGLVDVKLNNGILYENGTPTGLVFSGSLKLCLSEYIPNAISIDTEINKKGIRYKPFLVLNPSPE